MSLSDLAKDPVLARVVMARAPGVTRTMLRRLYETFGGIAGVLSRDESEILAAGPGAENVLKAVRDAGLMDGARREIEAAHKDGIEILVPESENYPEELRSIDDRPSVLYVKGSLPQGERRIAIVGTRSPTISGTKSAGYFAQSLAAAGVCVTSGLAVGIDTFAHEGALKSGGRTIAVLGSGILRIYPRENRRLAERIAESGALISEYALCEEAQSFHFPMRNRIISGLSAGVLVAEAPQRSGALITAGMALEQGRDVFSVPGSVLNPKSAGSNQLIKEGAFCATSPDDVLFHMGWPAAAPRAPRPENPDDRMVLEVLDPEEPRSADELAQLSGISARDLLARLSDLELKGAALQVSGGKFVRSGGIGNGN